MPPGRVGRVGDGNGPREWLESLPVITRAWFLGSVVSTCLLSFGMVSATRLVWQWELVSRKFEVWRLVTPFLVWGSFSFPFLINMYVLVQYSRNYEAGPYDTGGGGSTADYAWMLAMGMAILLALSTFLGVVAPSQGLTYMVMYAWSRRNPTTPVSLYGFQLQAVYLPWALLLFNMVIGNDLTAPLMGVFAGHVYYFAVDAAPAQYGLSADLVSTPQFLIDLFHGGGGGPATRVGGGFTATAPPGRNNNEHNNRNGLFQRRPNTGGGGHHWGAGRPLGAD